MNPTNSPASSPLLLILEVLFESNDQASSKTGLQRNEFALSEPKAKAWLQRVSGLVNNPDYPFQEFGINSSGRPNQDERAEFDAESIASFVDGLLDNKKSARLEQECWNSDSLLLEVISNYRFQREEHQTELIVDTPSNDSSEIQSRVLASLDLNFVETVIDNPEHYQNAENNLANAGTKVNLSDRGRISASPIQQDKSASTGWLHHAFQVALVLAVLLAVFYSIQDANRVANGPYTDTKEKEYPNEKPESIEQNEKPKTVINSINQQVVSKGKKALDQQRHIFPDKAQQKPIRCLVRQVQGVALKKNAQGRWLGVLASNGDKVTSIATLPHSRLKAHFQDIGSVVVEPQTIIQFNRELDNSVFNVELGQGEIQFAELAAHTSLRLFLARKRCDLIMGQEPTRLSLALAFGGLHIKIDYGSVTVVHDNQVYELNPDKSIVVGLASVTWKETPPNQESPTKFTKAKNVTSTNQATLDSKLLFSSPKKANQILNTLDVDSLLKEWKGRGDSQSHLLLQSVLLALAPDKHMFEFLHGTETQRRVAFSWLTSVTYQSKNYQTVMAVLREKFGPIDIRSFSASIKLIMYQQNGRRQVFPTVIKTILEGLNHNSIGIRQASDLALQKLTQSTVDYEPGADPTQRSDAIERWKTKLERLKLSSPANPKK